MPVINSYSSDQKIRWIKLISLIKISFKVLSLAIDSLITTLIPWPSYNFSRFWWVKGYWILTDLEGSHRSVLQPIQLIYTLNLEYVYPQTALSAGGERGDPLRQRASRVCSDGCGRGGGTSYYQPHCADSRHHAGARYGSDTVTGFTYFG